VVVFVRRPKIGKRDLKAETLGLGVRIALPDSGLDKLFPAEEAADGCAGADSFSEGRRERGFCWPGAGDENIGRPTGAEARRLLCRLSDKEVEERLLWMMGIDRPSWDWRSGVPSLLGLAGGVALLPTTALDWAARAGRWRECDVALGFDGDVINGWAGSREDFEGDSSSSRLFLSFCDDFRGGGLGGSGDSLFFFLSFLSPSRTVELDDEDVKDSLTAARPRGSALTGSASFDMLSALLRVIGGLVNGESACLIRVPAVGIRIGATRPGDCDEIEVVGVVSRLYGPGPGEPEKRVDGLPLKPLIWLLVPENRGVGGGRS